jgi:tellurite resistance protein
MNWDWDEIKKKAQEFADEADKKIKQYTPESFSKEKKFVNTVVTSIVLMIVADKKVETHEVTKAMDLIANIQEIQDLQMQQEAIELFEMHLSKLGEIMNNEVKFVIETSKLLGDISKVKEYPEYVPMIQNLIDYISNAEQTAEEKDMKNKILQTIS